MAKSILLSFMISTVFPLNVVNGKINIKIFNSIMSNSFLENRLQTLPKAYLKCLNEMKVSTAVKINESVDQREWRVLTKKQLVERIKMNNVGEAYCFEILKLHIAIYKEFAFEKYIHTANGKVTLERISKGFTFAEENGDYLYFDTEDENSIWIYYQDGGDVEKVANSFNELF